ncbi:MAG: VCBS repeat-containing protein [Acidimicrobiia bacterium]|nr:VCBS repeat-containing protein [Acidimicrobiia bacterium]
MVHQTLERPDHRCSLGGTEATSRSPLTTTATGLLTSPCSDRGTARGTCDSRRLGLPRGSSGATNTTNSFLKLVPGDYNGDGRSEIAAFRPWNDTWYVRSLAGWSTGFQWGNADDIPVPGDYDGDKVIDYAVYRPSANTWYIKRSRTGAGLAFAWGNAGDKPVPADYDGDGKTDFAVFRPSGGTWYIRYSGTSASATIPWGNTSDVPVPGDYDGDAKVDVAIFRPSNGTWYVKYASGGSNGFQWGNGNDTPILKQ